MNAPTEKVPAAPQTEADHTSLEKESLKRAFLDNLLYVQGKFPAVATLKDFYLALAYAVRDHPLLSTNTTINLQMVGFIA